MTIQELIATQCVEENTPEFMVGEQLKDICGTSESLAAIIAEDFKAGHGLKEAAAQIKNYADEQQRKKKGNCVCVPPMVAEKIIREFFGLPEADALAQDDMLQLEAFL